MRITLVAGARPNFIKVAPVIHAIEKVAKDIIKYRLLHTGQHFDINMSDKFFSELNIPAPDINVECGGGSHAEQTVAIMIAFEREVMNNPPNEYIVLTLHRPNNVDEDKKLKIYIEEITNNVNGLPVIFPVHPSTAKIFNELNIKAKSLIITEPLGYLEFNYLVERAKAVITDSGGITEETTVMGVPCMTLRDNTERPETVEIGTNELLGTKPESIKPALKKLFDRKWKKGKIPEKCDVKVCLRILEQILIVNVN